MKFLKFLLIILLVPFIVMAEECDLSKMTITAMELSGREGEADEVDVPTFQDRNISLNLKLYEVGDSISYNMTIKNDSEEDYMLDEDAFKTDSEYIEYSLRTNDNSNVVKAGSTKELTLVVTYKKEVDDDLLTNNKFDASNNLKLSMNTSEKEQELDVITTDNIKESVDPVEEANPSTGAASLTILVIVLVIMLIVLLTIMQKKKYNKYLILILSMSLIPVVYAVCKVDVEVESTIEIEKNQKLFDTVVGLSHGDNACVTKYEGEVTDEVGKTVEATNVYFDKCVDKRNVIFGGFCWQIIRTTESGGTKIIYNGEPEDGKCESTRGKHKGIAGQDASDQALNSEYLYGDSFEYDISNNEYHLIDTEAATWSESTYQSLLGKFTCKNMTGICTTMYNVNSINSDMKAKTTVYKIGDTNYAQIGESSFNPNGKSIAMAGYMFNKVNNYLGNGSPDSAPDNGTLKGNDVSYSNGVYTLLPSVGESQLSTLLNATNHYTCNNTTGSCTKVRYYFSRNYYIELEGGKNVQDLLYELLYADDVNKYNSSIKGVIDSWYAQNLSEFTNQFEDVVYCNDRNITSIAGWNPNGGDYSSRAQFKGYNMTPSLVCQNDTDQFSISNSKAKLTYPIALLRSEELANMNEAELLKTGRSWLSLSPISYGTSTVMRDVYSDGTIWPTGVSGVPASGVRPVVSLKSEVKLYSGTGSETDPWIVE